MTTEQMILLGVNWFLLIGTHIAITWGVINLLVAKILIRNGDYTEAVEAESDMVTSFMIAFALCVLAIIVKVGIHNAC